MALVGRSDVTEPRALPNHPERWIGKVRALAVLLLLGPVMVLSTVAWLASTLLVRLWQGLGGCRRNEPFG